MRGNRVARFRLTTRMLVLAGIGVVAGVALGSETLEGSCTVKRFSYTQVCPRPLKFQGSPPQLLDERGRRQPCGDLTPDDAPLARLEVSIDRQGRLVRAKLLDQPGPCATKCLEHALRLTFLPASTAGVTTMGSTTVLCKSPPASDGARGRTTR